MIPEKLATVLTRKLAGEATDEELQLLEAWMKEHPEDQYFIELMHAYWNCNQEPILNEESAGTHFSCITRTDKKEGIAKEQGADFSDEGGTQKARWKKRLLIAASIIAVFCLGWLFTGGDTTGAGNQHIITASRGERTRVLLPDGSTVWMNSESRIRFDTAFNGAERAVFLEGEAYFDVVKNPEKPFVVHVGAYDIRVLGTAFNVKAYQQDSVIETTLVRGKVEVLNKSDPHGGHIILLPNNKLILTGKRMRAGQEATAGADYAINPVTVQPGDTDLPETAWMHNRLVFEGDTFKELAEKMERWYNVKIYFKEESIANNRLRGAFEKESVSEALNALQLIIPFNYNITGNVVEITK